jgi:hypothetical protein
MVRGAYDIQKLRIQMGNRIAGNFRAKLGQEAGTKTEDMEEDAKAILVDLKERYRKLMDGIKTFPRQPTFKGDEVISTYTELCLLDQYMGLEKSEAQHFRRFEAILEEFAIYREFLKDVKGIGPAMAGVILSEFDIHKARYPSSLWQYAGLGVESDGRGTSRRKEHLKEVEYEDKDGKPQTRMGVRFNPWLKTKLVGVLASSFLRVGDSPYRVIYDDYKHRMESHAKYGTAHDGEKDENDHKVTGKGRRHNMAMRYMIKMFLVDLYKAWRALENLPVSPPYSEAKLGLRHVG